VKWFLLITTVLFSTMWGQADPQRPPSDRADVGWIAVVRDDEGWRVTRVEALLSPVKGGVPQLRKCNLQPGDQLVSIDGQSLSGLGPLGMAALLDDLPFSSLRVELLRRGDPYLVRPFADRIAQETDHQPKFSPDQLPKRDGPAPDFSLPSLDGQQLTLTSLRGRWVLLNFWGTWCEGCMQELPALKDLASHHRSELVVVGIAVNDSREAVQNFREAQRLPYMVLLGGTLDDPTARAYAVDRVPANVVVDPEGMVRFVGVGPLSLKAAVETVMAGSRSLSTSY